MGLVVVDGGTWYSLKTLLIVIRYHFKSGTIRREVNTVDIYLDYFICSEHLYQASMQKDLG